MATQTSLFFFFLVAVTRIFAFELTEWTSLSLEKRSINPAGGWPANAFNAVNNTDCPAGNTYCFGGNCCPSELTCVGTEDPVNCVCCPEGSSCETIFQHDPVCANSEWVLWNATTQGQYGGFFCCQQGQIGDNTGGCWPAGTQLDSTQQAITITPGTHSSVPVTGKIKLSKGVMIGIAIAAVVLVILLALALGCCCWKCLCKKKRKTGEEGYNLTYEPYRQQ